jgi:hypothetical protein
MALRQLPYALTNAVRNVRHEWIAAALFIFGWSLVWAHGLRLINFVPDWLALSAMVAGLVAIPKQRAD